MTSSEPIVLASRSPRRIELLERIVPSQRILVVPPPSSEEPGFDRLHTIEEIEVRILQIAQLKHDAVCELLQERKQSIAAVIAADTTVVATDKGSRLVVIGQPPETSDWIELVRSWFRDYYCSREHSVLTAVVLSAISNRSSITRAFVVKSTVQFGPISDRQLEWYLSTGESRGKAGGYAIQGAAGMFVNQVRGSLTNVIGLPLLEVQRALWELDVDVSLGR